MTLKFGFLGVTKSTKGIYEGPMTIGDMVRIDNFRAQNRLSGPQIGQNGPKQTDCEIRGCRRDKMSNHYDKKGFSSFQLPSNPTQRHTAQEDCS